MPRSRLLRALLAGGAAAALALALTGCASSLPPAPPAVVCPALPPLDRALRDRAADELERLGEGAALGVLTADYIALRAAVRACQSAAAAR
jgi:hypothetical protein